MLKDSVARWAREVVAPKVREMDEKKKMDADIIKGMFESGFMGIETSEELGGAGMSFTSAVLVRGCSLADSAATH